MKVKKNMGTTDQIIRLAVAVVLAVAYFTGTISDTLGLIGLIVAVIFVITSIFSFCPLYLPFGISTKK